MQLALVLGLVLVAAGVAVTLTGSSLTVAHEVSTADEEVAGTVGETEFCQSGETLPAHTSDIRLALWSTAGPRLRLTVLSANRVATGGTHAPGWSTGAVTVAVKPLARTLYPVRVCLHLDRNPDKTTVYGTRTAVATGAARGDVSSVLPGKLGIEYLRPASHSWWSSTISVARRMGLGRSPGGTWTVLLLLIVAATMIAVAVRLAAVELR